MRNVREGGRRASLRDQPGEGAFDHVDAQLQEFAMDSGGAPQRISLGHSGAKGGDLGQTQKSRSLLRSLGRFAFLSYTASCWRKARISRASWQWPPQRNGKRRSKWSSVLIMGGRLLRIGAERSTLVRWTGFWRRTRYFGT